MTAELRRRWLGLALGAGVGMCLAAGCSQDVRQAGRKHRSPVVRTVSYYDVTLDQKASPGQVAYVALRAIRDDFLAEDEAQREAALDKQFDLCAANEIQRQNSTTITRDEFIHKVVWLWTPTVSHYVGDFETELDKALARFLVVPKSRKEGEAGAPRCEIRMAVADPGGDPRAGAVLVIYLVMDSGYWRVTHLGFDPTTRSIIKPTSDGPEGN